MKPMDFEEFLWAKGISEDVVQYLRECYKNKTPVSDATHQAMLRYFKEYICVGGLPYIVDQFITTNDMNVVWQDQRDIIEEYRDDFGKHLDENENEEIDLTLLARINRVFESIPAQLAKENKKFVFSVLEKKGRSENYLPAIQWLCDFGIITLCHNLNNITEPLEGNKIDNDISLIEVKATTGNTKSAKTVLKNSQYGVNMCYKLSENNIGVAENIITIPYYMTFLL